MRIGYFLAATVAAFPMTMDKLMLMNQQHNGLDTHNFIVNNKAARDQFALIQALVSSNPEYKDSDVTTSVADDIKAVKDNIDQSGLEQMVARSAEVGQFAESSENAQRAAKLILENPAFAGKSIDPYVLAQAFGADERYAPPPPSGDGFNCRNSCRLQCDYLDGKRKCNFFCGLVC